MVNFQVRLEVTLEAVGPLGADYFACVSLQAKTTEFLGGRGPVISSSQTTANANTVVEMSDIDLMAKLERIISKLDRKSVV